MYNNHSIRRRLFEENFPEWWVTCDGKGMGGDGAAKIRRRGAHHGKPILRVLPTRKILPSLGKEGIHPQASDLADSSGPLRPAYPWG